MHFNEKLRFQNYIIYKIIVAHDRNMKNKNVDDIVFFISTKDISYFVLKKLMHFIENNMVFEIRMRILLS